MKIKEKAFMQCSVKIVGFGDNVNTDLIHAPSKFGISRGDLSSEFVLKGEDAKDSNRLILAGKNFGIGSSRFSTSIALKNSGIVAVFAVSISRIFERNIACAGIYPVTAGPFDMKKINAGGSGDYTLRIFAPAGEKSARAVIFCGEKLALSGIIDPFCYEIASHKGMVNYIAGGN